MRFKCTEVRCNTFLPIEYCIITDNKLPYCTGGEGVNLYLVYNWYAITLELTSEFLSSFIIPSSFCFYFLSFTKRSSWSGMRPSWCSRGKHDTSIHLKITLWRTHLSLLIFTDLLTFFSCTQVNKERVRVMKSSNPRYLFVFFLKNEMLASSPVSTITDSLQWESIGD